MSSAMSRDFCHLRAGKSLFYEKRMVKRFRDAFMDALAAKREAGETVTMKDVAEATGVSYEQIKKMVSREGARTNVDDAARIANFFGLTLDEMLGDRTAAIRSEIVELYNQLEEQERQFLSSLAKRRCRSTRSWHMTIPRSASRNSVSFTQAPNHHVPNLFTLLCRQSPAQGRI